jgi:hypothetical protein
VKELLVAGGAACVYLTTSFRATPEIQNLVNAAFAPVMTDDRAALQAGYVPLAPHRDALGGQPALVARPVPKPYGRYGLTKFAVDESTPHAVGAFVAWLLDESGWTVTERERPGEVLPISARHVCLLFRRFTSWAPTSPGRTSRRWRRAASPTCWSAAARSTCARRSRACAPR